MSDITSQRLVAVHVCTECGGATERANANQDSLITGLIRCSHCGHEAALNVEIRDRQGKKAPATVKELSD